MARSDTPLEGPDLDRILAVLGPAARVSYAPPNVYPMSAPRFMANAGMERPHPDGRDLGIYVHVPFCSYHCTFCFYATTIGANAAQKHRYVQGLLKELAWLPARTHLTQLYIGGGTPTALPSELLAAVLTAVFDRVTSSSGQVHTVEASPETLVADHVAVLKLHGVERVSMGVQSLSDEVLGTIKRRHTREMVEASCQSLIDAGLMVNIDLIYGLPGQTLESFLHDLEAVAGLGVHSVTTYNLRVNERTPVAKSLGDQERLDLSGLVRWRSAIASTANDLGFAAKRWHTFQRREPKGPAADVVRRFDDATGHGNQFGAGNSARSRLNGVVFRNHSGLDAYLERIEGNRSPVEETFPLSDHEQKLRFVALTLGDGKALERTAYAQAFGCSVDNDFAEPLARLFDAGLIDEQHGSIHLTEAGQLLYDLVTRAFYPETVRRWMEERQATAGSRAAVRGTAAPSNGAAQSRVRGDLS
jgi:oxygen-independent coproporphyrinogen-3 oxidase